MLKTLNIECFEIAIPHKLAKKPEFRKGLSDLMKENGYDTEWIAKDSVRFWCVEVGDYVQTLS